MIHCKLNGILKLTDDTGPQARTGTINPQVHSFHRFKIQTSQEIPYKCNRYIHLYMNFQCKMWSKSNQQYWWWHYKKSFNCMSVQLPLKLDNLQNKWFGGKSVMNFFSITVEATSFTLTNMHIVTLEVQTEIQTCLHVKWPYHYSVSNVTAIWRQILKKFPI